MFPIQINAQTIQDVLLISGFQRWNHGDQPKTNANIFAAQNTSNVILDFSPTCKHSGKCFSDPLPQEGFRISENFQFAILPQCSLLFVLALVVQIFPKLKGSQCISKFAAFA